LTTAHTFICYLRLCFRADRPHVLGIATFIHEDSTPLKHRIVTATMGNFARLRKLQLAQCTILAGELWPKYRGSGFTSHARFPIDELVRTPEGHAVAVTSPNAARPGDAKYAPGTRMHWRYIYEAAAQHGRSENPHAGLELWVNGRSFYWSSETPIPGGVAYENFEMVAPFRQGEEFWFGVEPLSANSSV